AISDLSAHNALAPNQATVLLQQSGFIGTDLPAPFIPATMMYLFSSLMLNHEMLFVDNFLFAFI
ncbi:hypothetical protein, partial [Fructilactobacillus lindneri]|uniref:hypothetical protein n=1 Tax=Fructilactobacillus lindneri TaxID=53444 RepID=UPI001CDB3BE7